MIALERKKAGEVYVRDILFSERDVKDCAEGCLKVGGVRFNRKCFSDVEYWKSLAPLVMTDGPPAQNDLQQWFSICGP